MIINADIRCNERYLLHEPCVVGKTITITGAEFDRLSQSLLEDNAIITENAEHMGYENNMHQCLLIVSDERQDGILVASEGCNYARYTAYVPNAKDVLLMQRLPPDLRAVLEKAPVIADWLVRRQDSAWPGGCFLISAEWLEDVHNINLKNSVAAQEILIHELKQRPEIAYADFDMPVFYVKYVEPILEPEMT